ncbi:hypothetical protein I4U23_008121 [Adineta vaga]|nr:hypothetical protein I4U23_008121 [Adineta vaga]
MFSSTIVCNIVRIYMALLVVNIVFGFDEISDDNRRFNSLLKQRSAENDNEYVWFTRDLHNTMVNDDARELIKRGSLGKFQHLPRPKTNNPGSSRKYRSIQKSMNQFQ